MKKPQKLLLFGYFILQFAISEDIDVLAPGKSWGHFCSKLIFSVVMHERLVLICQGGYFLSSSTFSTLYFTFLQVAFYMFSLNPKILFPSQHIFLELIKSMSTFFQKIVSIKVITVLLR